MKEGPSNNLNRGSLVQRMPYLCFSDQYLLEQDIEMSGNSFGKAFCITTFGESHGPALGVVIDGCPAGLEIDLDFIQKQLDRRRPGQSDLTTPRREPDRVMIYSGVLEGMTTGTPIMMMTGNKDARQKDYKDIKEVYRPGHADFTYDKKYGFRDRNGGGRASARETAARVMAGGVAQLLLRNFGIRIRAFVDQIGHLKLPQEYKVPFKAVLDESPVRCPDIELSMEMSKLIRKVKSEGDSIGGAIRCEITGMMAGLGEPVFDKLHADLGKAMLSINACKGFEIGEGFRAANMRGSIHNDEFVMQGDTIKTKTNHAGGVLGGISNGMDIRFRCAFKPVSTIQIKQETVNVQGGNTSVKVQGRHDPCVVPRVVPIVEAMAALVIADHLLRNRMARL